MKLFQKTIVTFLFVFTFLSMLPTQRVQAHDTYFLRVLVDKGSFVFKGSVELDRVGNEAQHAEYRLGNFSAMKNGINPESPTNYDTSTADLPPMLFSFPSKEVVTDGTVNNATSKDAERAHAVNNFLISNLNKMVIMLNDNKQITDLTVFTDISKAIIGASDGTGSAEYNGWTIKRNSTGKTLKFSKEGFPTVDLRYSMRKGYGLSRLDDGSESPLYSSVYNDDVSNITVGMLAAQGFYNMTTKNLTVENVASESNPSYIEKQIAKLFENLFNGIRSLLGLYSIDELVFGKGERMQYEFVHGTMKQSWMDVSIAFYGIFQVLAWIIIAFSIIKIMFDKTLSTFSVFKQISLINSVKNIIITGFLLASSFLVIQGLLLLNSSIVKIFAGATSFSLIGGESASSGVLAVIFLNIFYFFIALYMNFIYIVRGLTVAVLIASAPIFIASIAFSSKGSQMFSKWARELLANIFIQSIHAFILGITLSVQLGSTGIEAAVLAFSLIPITKMFKGLILGDAGGVMEGVAGGFSAAGAGMAVGAVSSAVGGKVGGKVGGGSGGSEGAPGANSIKERKEHSSDTPSAIKTSKAMKNSKEGTGTMDSGGTDSGAFASKTASKYHQADSSIDSWGSGLQEGTVRKNLTDAAKTPAKAVAGVWNAGGKSVAKTAIGVAGVGAGVALSAVAGPQAGKDLIRGGSNLIGSGVRGGVEAVANASTDAYRGMTGKLGGTVLGSEKTTDGGTTVHRDISSLKNMGYDEAYSNQNGTGITYNPQKMDSTELGYLNQMRSLEQKDWKNYGLNSVSENADGRVTIEYGKAARNEMGFNDLYSTKNRMVETKANHHNASSKYIINPTEFRAKREAQEAQDALSNGVSKAN